ncbi:MAG: 30S ribosomal protein S8 [candidate division Zixibacteria bacterium]|nr:30S ribosomal protein S8 [candidate division Zixibacteria bacterium]
MKITDPIADMLTRIRNAYKAKHKTVDIPGSKIKKEIARILQENGCIRKQVEVEDNKQNILRLYLSYDSEGKSNVYGLKRISKPGLRIYYDKDKLKKISREFGFFILSTSMGIMTDDNARLKGIGGEVICHIR